MLRLAIHWRWWVRMSPHELRWMHWHHHWWSTHSCMMWHHRWRWILSTTLIAHHTRWLHSSHHRWSHWHRLARRSNHYIGWDLLMHGHRFTFSVILFLHVLIFISLWNRLRLVLLLCRFCCCWLFARLWQRISIAATTFFLHHFFLIIIIIIILIIDITRQFESPL